MNWRGIYKRYLSKESTRYEGELFSGDRPF